MRVFKSEDGKLNLVHTYEPVTREELQQKLQNALDAVKHFQKAIEEYDALATTEQAAEPKPPQSIEPPVPLSQKVDMVGASAVGVPMPTAPAESKPAEPELPPPIVS